MFAGMARFLRFCISSSLKGFANRELDIGGTSYSNAHFGVGRGPIFLDDVQCTSSSDQLLECPSRPILSHNCLHSADSGVGCEGVFDLMTLVLFRVSFLSRIQDITSLMISFPQPHVLLVSCDWQEVTFQMKVEWRSA